MNQKINTGIELWSRISELVNFETAVTGILEPNNKAVWRVMNTWSNREWFSILCVVAEIEEQQPELFTKSQKQALQKAAGILVTQAQQHSRCLDTPPNRKLYWQFVMTLREVWNKIHQTTEPLFKFT